MWWVGLPPIPLNLCLCSATCFPPPPFPHGGGAEAGSSASAQTKGFWCFKYDLLLFVLYFLVYNLGIHGTVHTFSCEMIPCCRCPTSMCLYTTPHTSATSGGKEKQNITSKLFVYQFTILYHRQGNRNRKLCCKSLLRQCVASQQ